MICVKHDGFSIVSQKKHRINKYFPQEICLYGKYHVSLQEINIKQG